MSFIHDTMFVNCKHIHIRANAMWSRGPDRIQGSRLSTLMWDLMKGRRKTVKGRRENKLTLLKRGLVHSDDVS